MDPFLIWSLVLFAYGLSWFAEWRRHRANYRFLNSVGAEELIPKQMRRYYSLIFYFLPLAALEHFALHERIFREMIVGGLVLVSTALLLRSWSIQSLGRLWSMRCLGLTGAPIVRRGPYRLFKNPEYYSRIIDGAGLFLIIGARVTLGVYLVVSIYLTLRIVDVERRQLSELAMSH